MVIIFAVLLSMFPATGALLLWRGNLRDGVLLFAIYVFALYLVCGMTIDLAPGRLVFRFFIVRKMDVDLTRVTAASMVYGPGPGLSLRRRGSREKPAVIPLKPFTRAGVMAILHHVRACSPGVKFDRVAQDLSEGRFDTVTRETIRAGNLLRAAVAIAATAMAVALGRALLHSLLP
jgi:hypothetical protein